MPLKGLKSDMIPIFDARRTDKKIKKEIRQAIEKTVKTGIFILGEKVREFEREFSKYLGVRYSNGVASGTDAISLALTASGVKPGDEVILPANSYPTVFAVAAIGAIPKPVDIDPLTFNIDPDKIETAISKKTRAVIPVHLYGQAADLDRILPIARRNRLAVIEDCAQAHGAEVKIGGKWKKVGTVGDAGCFSFYPTKNLGCFGDGGAVVSNNREIYRKVRELRMYGEKKRYESAALGRNSRLDELQAAILLVKLKYLDRWNRRRREIARRYGSEISAKKKSDSGIRLPGSAGYARHVYHLYVIRSDNRDKLRDYLEKRGVGTAIHYPKPIHLQSSFSYLGHKEGDFPKSEKASKEVLSLPMFPELTDKEIEITANAINNFR